MIFGPNFIARGWTLWRDAIRIPSHLGIARRTQAPGKLGRVSVSTLNHSGGAGMHTIVCNVCMYIYVMYNTYILYTRVVHSTDFDNESHKASATSRSGHLRRLKKPGLIRCTRRQDLLQHRQLSAAHAVTFCYTMCYTVPGKLRQAKVRET